MTRMSIARLVRQPGQYTSSHGMPANSAQRIVGDHSAPHPAASAAFQRSTTRTASQWATCSAARVHMAARMLSVRCRMAIWAAYHASERREPPCSWMGGWRGRRRIGDRACGRERGRAPRRGVRPDWTGSPGLSRSRATTSPACHRPRRGVQSDRSQARRHPAMVEPSVRSAPQRRAIQPMTVSRYPLAWPAGWPRSHTVTSRPPADHGWA